MKEIRQEIKKQIKSVRSNLSDSSITTYTSLLCSLFKQFKFESYEDFIKNQKEDTVMEYVEKLKSESSKKTLLSILFILTGSPTFQQAMLGFIKTTNEKYHKSKVDIKRVDAYITPEQVLERFHKSETALKSSPTADHYVEYFITSLMSGVKGYPIPRRLEWSMMKIRNYNKNTDNYLDSKGVFHFNVYKTAKTYGAQTVQCPKDVLAWIKKWMKINSSDYLMTTKTGKSMSASQLSIRIGRIYGDKVIGQDILRSIFITDLYSKVLPSQEELIKIATAMGHSIQSQMFYRKIDIKTKD